MNRITKSILAITAILLLSNCSDNPNTPNENDVSTIAIGTYINNDVDKDEWGDFQLVLELDKSRYQLGEDIYVKLYFKNIGTKTITLDGILPHRNIASPPIVEFWSTDKTKFQIEQILDNLLNDKDIIIPSKESETLMHFNLTTVDGLILTKDTSDTFYNAEEIENIGEYLKNGEYNMRAYFLPTPQIYWSETDTLKIFVE